MFIMRKTNFLLEFFIIYFFLNSFSFAINANFFEEAKVLFDKKEFKKSQILFERDIVFNPKSENSYLYLAKIFNQNEDHQQEEVNLNNVLVLNPNNEDAIYMLASLKIKQSDYSEAKKLIKKFGLVCKSLCMKKHEKQNNFDKFISKDEKNNN